jgi:hypothetical protein
LIFFLIVGTKGKDQMNTFFQDKNTIERMKEGPLGQYIVQYANQMRAEGYARQSGRIQIRLVADFSRWLARKGIAAKQLAAQHTGNFLRSRKRAGYQSTNADQSALARLGRLLREQGVITDRTPKTAATPSEVLLDEYDRYLQKERSLVLSTRINYRPFIRRFLVGKFAAGSVELPDNQCQGQPDEHEVTINAVSRDQGVQKVEHGIQQRSRI